MERNELEGVLKSETSSSGSRDLNVKLRPSMMMKHNEESTGEVSVNPWGSSGEKEHEAAF